MCIAVGFEEITYTVTVGKEFGIAGKPLSEIYSTYTNQILRVDS